MAAQLAPGRRHRHCGGTGGEHEPRHHADERWSPVEVPVAVYVGDSSLAQSPPQAVPSLRKMANMTGFMYYFLGLERRAKKGLWILLAWCLGVLTRMKECAAEVISCDA